MNDKVVTLPVVRVERNEEPPEPFGWVAFYCGAELFMRSRGAADFYAQLCKVIPVYAEPVTNGVLQMNGDRK